MIVKKSTIVLLSAIFVLNLYFIFQIGVRHGQHKAIIPIRRGLDIARAVQKPDRSKGMQNGESVLERQETPVINLGRITITAKWQIFNVSAYSNHAKCIKKEFRDGRTASGKRVRFGYVALDKNFNFGTRIEFKEAIRGRKTFICEDRGRLIKGNCVDIYLPTYAEALRFGRQERLGRILK